MNTEFKFQFFDIERFVDKLNCKSYLARYSLEPVKEFRTESTESQEVKNEFPQNRALIAIYRTMPNFVEQWGEFFLEEGRTREDYLYESLHLNLRRIKTTNATVPPFTSYLKVCKGSALLINRQDVPSGIVSILASTKKQNALVEKIQTEIPTDWFLSEKTRQLEQQFPESVAYM